MITTRTWIVMAATVLMGIAAAVIWFTTRNVRCVDSVPTHAAIQQQHAGQAGLVRVQDEQPEDPVSPPAPEERDLQEAERKTGSPCGAYLDNVQSWRAITLGATGVGILGSALSLYMDNEARKRHRRRRRRRLPVA